MSLFRRKESHASKKIIVNVTHPVAADADLIAHAFTVPAGRKFRLEKAYYYSQAGIAEDASNHFLISVKKGTTIMASWNTDSDGAEPDNSIVADTPKELTLSTTDTDLVADGGDIIRCHMDESGTTTTTPGNFVIEGRLV